MPFIWTYAPSGRSSRAAANEALASDGAVDAVLVQGPIHGFGARRLGQVQRRLPGGAPGVIILASAFVARAMSGGDGDRFVQKEEFRVAVRRHHVALTAAKRGEADDPIVVCPARRRPSSFVSPCRIPRLPMKSPRAKSASMVPNGVSVLAAPWLKRENGSQKIRPLDEPVLVDAVPEVRATQGLHGEIAFLWGLLRRVQTFDRQHRIHFAMRQEDGRPALVSATIRLAPTMRPE